MKLVDKILNISIYGSKYREDVKDEDRALLASAYYYYEGYDLDYSKNLKLTAIKNFTKHPLFEGISKYILKEKGRKVKKNLPLKLTAIRMLENTGAGLNVAGYERFMKDVKGKKIPNWRINKKVNNYKGVLEIADDRMMIHRNMANEVAIVNLFIDVKNPTLSGMMMWEDKIIN